MTRTFFTIALCLIATPSFAILPAEKLELEASLSSVSQKNLKGNLILERVKEGIKIKAHVTGLDAHSKHGFHIHQVGECAGPDYKSAGDHYNPHKMKHGSPESKNVHAGDLGNLIADEKGEAHLEKILPQQTEKDFKEMMAKSVLIHAKADDLKTQPAGDSGDRIGCGILQSI